MSKSDKFVLILMTAPTLDEAKKIARSLLEKKEVACANLFSCDSLFSWKGAIEESKEIQLIFKTKESLFDAVKKTILSLTSYEVPEIVMVPIISGHAPYLDWVKKCVKR